MRWAIGLMVVALLGSTVPAGATPVCAEEPRTVCGDRIFPEADSTTAFVQHDMGEYADGINALAAEFPRFVKVRTFSEVLGTETLSAGGRELWLVEITDFDVVEKDKVAVAASLSVHGPERAGLEGGVRFMEDLATWAADEPDHLLMNGTEEDSIEIPASEAVRKVHYYFADANPDGWADGDVANGGVFMRGNGNGIDLNRQFPTLGWTKTSGRPLPVTEPEAKAWVKLIRQIDPVVTTDIHGELTSAQDAFADMMYPAGQWNPTEQAQQERAARHMQSNVERYFQEDGVVIGDATGAAGMQPAQYATGFDVVGYDDSGFMGDWFTQEIGALDMDVEHFLSHYVPNSTWSAPLEKAHIAAVRGELESLMVEAIAMTSVKPRLNLGTTGYLYDPKVITDADGYGGPKPPKGQNPKHYRSTRMRYFEDLSERTTTPLRKLWTNDVYQGGLEGLDSFVIAGRPYPRTRSGRKPDSVRMAKALGDFVRDGGNLVLTDRGVRLLKKLGVVPKSAITRKVYGAGHIDIDDFEDPYLNKVHSTASQTYYEVGLGYTLGEDSSPHWVVARGVWAKAGGTGIAHIEEDPDVGLGRLKLGDGTIGILGALLPPATEKYDHLYGLADYAVTVAGGQILNNMIAFGL